MVETKYQGFKPAICPDDCIYLQTVNGNELMCGYMLMTDELRGCDPGYGCKRYVGKLEKLRGYKKSKPKWDVDQGKRMWLAGCSDGKIAKAMAVSRGTVRQYRRRKWEVDNG